MSEQPMPQPGRFDVTPVARGTFLEMLAQREARGIEAYGTSLQTHNGRDALRDLMEELVDAWQYSVQARMEHINIEAENDRLRALVISLGGQP